MAKVTGKFQITLPRSVADAIGVKVGDELDVRPVGGTIQMQRRTAMPSARAREERLSHFDKATERQRARQAHAPRVRPRSRGWTRAELYTRGRTR
jgi:AbrB family looped-hinge helix DNA binding protein